MKINAVVVVGFLSAVIAFAALAVISTQQPFPEFKYSTQSAQYPHLISLSQNIGPEDSKFMWTNNSLSLITQAFALFAAAAATLAMLTRDAKEKQQ